MKNVPPPQFAIHQVDPTSVFIEAILPAEQVATFEDIFDIYSKTDTEDDQWTKSNFVDGQRFQMSRSIV